MTDTETLFAHARQLHYPDTMQMIAGEISGLAFFPGGRGTYNNDETLRDKDIMLLGQDFDTEENFEKARAAGQEDKKKNATWRNLLALLKETNVDPRNCFFTNAIMGVRKEGKGTGKSPAFKDKEFIEECRELFLKQLKVQRPKAVFVLGLQVIKFLAGTSAELASWEKVKNFKSFDDGGNQVKRDVKFNNGVIANIVVLTHPSLRNVNVRFRSYQGLSGHEAELKMVKDARA